jgi:hypothetical protein
MIYNADFVKVRHAELLAEATRVRLAKTAAKTPRSRKSR